MLLNCGVGEDSWESLGLQGDPTSPPWRKSVLNVHWKEWCWSWNSNTLATGREELTHWKRPWCWERLKVGGEGDNRGWDGWMASLTQRTWVWVSSGCWWWTGKPGVLQSMGSQRVRHDWATELRLKRNYKFPVHLMKGCSFYTSQLRSKPPFKITEMSNAFLKWHTATVVLWLWKVQDSCALGCLRKSSPIWILQATTHQKQTSRLESNELEGIKWNQEHKIVSKY